MSIKRVCKRYGVPASTVYKRLNNGLTLDEALTEMNLSNKKYPAAYIRKQKYKQLKKDYEFFKREDMHVAA